jgi:hypothetical protein
LQLREQTSAHSLIAEASRGDGDVPSIVPTSMSDSPTCIPLKRTSSKFTVLVDGSPSSKRTKIDAAADKENVGVPRLAGEGTERAISDHRYNEPGLFADLLDPIQSHRSVTESFMEYVTKQKDIKDIATLRKIR